MKSGARAPLFCSKISYSMNKYSDIVAKLHNNRFISNVDFKYKVEWETPIFHSVKSKALYFPIDTLKYVIIKAMK